MRDGPVNQLADVIAVIGWFPVALFVLFYGLRSPWRKHLVGRSLMYQSIAMLVVLTIVIIGLWWPDMPGRDWVRLIGYGFLVATMWRMFFTLLHYQNLPFEKEIIAPLDNEHRL